MNRAKAGDTVRVHYTGTLDDDTQFDCSSGRDPIEFAIGSRQVIPGFENAVEGMSVGEHKSVRIEAEEGYGTHHQQLIQEVPKSALPEGLTPALGMQLQARDSENKVTNLTVTQVADESITVDANHPLAGKALNFDIELVEIVELDPT